MNIDKINKIRCNSCNSKKGVRPAVLKKRLEKQGITLEELLATYVCQSCKKKNGKTYTTQTTEEPVKKIDGFWTKEDYSFNTNPSEYDDIPGLTARICLVPSLLLDHRCDLCPYYEQCECTDQNGALYKSVIGTTKLKRYKKKKQ